MDPSHHDSSWFLPRTYHNMGVEIKSRWRSGGRGPRGPRPPTPPYIRSRIRRFLTSIFLIPAIPPALKAPSFTSWLPATTSSFKVLRRGICSGQIERRIGSAHQVQPFTDWLGQLVWRLLTSANPSLHLTMQLAPRQVDRSPRVRRVTFIPYTRRIYFHTFPDGYRALDFMASSPRCGCLICGFCSSGRDFTCSFLQIPGRPGHPCCSANGSHHQGP